LPCSRVWFSVELPVTPDICTDRNNSRNHLEISFLITTFSPNENTIEASRLEVSSFYVMKLVKIHAFLLRTRSKNSYIYALHKRYNYAFLFATYTPKIPNLRSINSEKLTFHTNSTNPALSTDTVVNVLEIQLYEKTATIATRNALDRNFLWAWTLCIDL
jgi:hypothetical protein